MNESIRYDLEVLQSKEQELQNISSDLKMVKKLLRRADETADEYWHGIARAAFQGKIKKVETKISEQSQNVETAKRNLTDSINLYRANEEKTKGAVENLSTEGIF